MITVVLLVSIVKSDIYYDLNDEDYSQEGLGRNFTGKVVLTTGSSSGIGEGIVKLFSRLGANVVVTGRKANEVQRVAEEAQELSPLKLKPLAIVADVTKSADLNRLISKTIDTYGKLDILVNNAGAGFYGSFRAPDFMTKFDQSVALNLRAYLELTHLAVPYLDETNGTIISISSTSSTLPTPGGLAYEVAKTGVDMMTRTLALELGPRIRVNTINPGLILTNFINHTDPDVIDKVDREVIARTPLKRPGVPLDIARAVVFLASKEASFITAANLVVDGGLVYNAGGLSSP
ncbi:unnamed protein product [Medioppia subpectinata]|uniref:Uncharacterized protein n=1 Tax=Medioppia subpectinata TaxID=1979941 RepID=A0A7R9L154_9ACAR|nr:unnamed protein product [Medioppia subpectinata]CAG2113661.1 unnamed protein product [Medioppia subpectinata]